MENIRIVNNSALLDEEIDDFISETVHEEDDALQNEIKKRKLTLIGLGSLYIILLLVSFTFLT